MVRGGGNERRLQLKASCHYKNKAMVSLINPSILPPLMDMRYATVDGLSSEEVAIAAISSKWERENEWLLPMLDAIADTDLEKLLATDPMSNASLDELESLAQQVERENQCQSTIAKELASVGRFEKFLTDNGVQLDLKVASVDDIAKFVRYFYAGLRKPDGSFYSPNTVVGVRSGLFRHIMKLRAIDIINDKAFHAANLTMKSICNAFLRSGGRVKHYDAIESDDLKKLGKYFDRSNPVRLQEEVYFNIIYYYGNRGREWLRGLRFDRFCEKRLANGLYAIELVQGDSKNLHGSISVAVLVDNKQALMVSKGDSAKCPVEAFRLYKQKVTEVEGWNGVDFFLRPNANFRSSGKWYSKSAVGVNTLGPLMKKISTSAGLSKPYTAHCVRATVITELHDAGFNVETIAKVTGHKRGASVERYIRRGNKREQAICAMSHQLTAAVEVATTADPQVVGTEASDPVDVINDPTSGSVRCVRVIPENRKNLKIRANGDTNVIEFVFE
ncbi:hypothetical protein BOX15_Mlig018289g4 [Macrostomum lignano]|uniref:Tyr recombinase domain-containing protein n=1 Tax=Macrostomum lignano TaxID=282301 RepID=A0A267DE34_9PLAT|nr:hypothetical protein BOX15_Mlig018289g4 [Macrostomum lignano]